MFDVARTVKSATLGTLSTELQNSRASEMGLFIKALKLEVKESEFTEGTQSLEDGYKKPVRPNLENSKLVNVT